jgi:hypothetical protein
MDRSLLLPKVQLLLEKLSSLNNKLICGKESPADRCLSALVHTLGMDAYINIYTFVYVYIHICIYIFVHVYVNKYI